MEAAFFDFINQFGYLAVAGLILFENIFPPIPSELILPLSGFFTTTTDMTLPITIVAATVGSVVGAFFLYGIGRLLSRERLMRFFATRPMRLLGFKPDDVASAVDWFDRKGQIVIDNEEEDLDEDTVMLDALEAGADDMVNEGDVFVIYTDPDALSEVVDALEAKGYTFVSWYTSTEYTTEFDFDTPIKGDMTVYAKWVEDEESTDPTDPTDPGTDPEEPGTDPENPGDGSGDQGGDNTDQGDNTDKGNNTTKPAGDATSTDDGSNDDADAADEDAIPNTGDATVAVSGIAALGTAAAGLGIFLRRRS